MRKVLFRYERYRTMSNGQLQETATGVRWLDVPNLLIWEPLPSLPQSQKAVECHAKRKRGEPEIFFPPLLPTCKDHQLSTANWSFGRKEVQFSDKVPTMAVIST